GSARIDLVAIAVDGERVVAGQELRHGGEFLEAIVAGATPRVLEDHDGGGPTAFQEAHELVPQRLDARVRLVVEEVEGVEKARGLPEVQPQERVHAAARDVHHLDWALAGQRPELTHQRGDTALLVGDPRRIGRVHTLDPEERQGQHDKAEGEPVRELRYPPSSRHRGARARGERDRGEGAGEETNGVEMILPALALGRVVGEPVDETQDGEPAPNAVRLRQPSRKTEESEGEQTAPDLPAEYVPTETFPHPDPSDATIERQDVAGENGRERPRATTPREPDEHEDRHGEPNDAPDDERADGAGAPGAERDHDGAADPEQHGLRLDHHARARREATPQSGRPDTPPPPP